MSENTIGEEEVYKFTQYDFNKEKCYSVANYYRKEGSNPNEKFFAKTIELRYVGKYDRTIEEYIWDNLQITHCFKDNEKENTIVVNRENICFKEVECKKKGGKRYRKNKKTKNKKTKRRRTRKH